MNEQLFYIAEKPVVTRDIETIYDDMAPDWLKKARKLRARRWDALKRNLKGY